MELETILLSENIVDSINDNIGYILKLIPEIKYMINFEHNNPNHHLNVWKHTLYALSLLPNDFDIRLCLLFHDIGKPFSYQDEEVRHFKGHSKVSSLMTKEILKRLTFDNKYIEKICYLVEHHDSPISDL